jgi:hypothetical protein
MKTKSPALATFALLAGLASTGAAFAATASGTASAEIVSAIAVSSTATLNFGQIAPSGTAGTVSISTAGVRSSTGGVTLGNQVAVAAASFGVTGAPNNVYTIVLPADGTVTLTSGGSPAMAVDGFVSNPASPGTLNGGGSDTILVGATLSVGVNQPNGSYSGTFPVTVAYQ